MDDVGAPGEFFEGSGPLRIELLDGFGIRHLSPLQVESESRVIIDRFFVEKLCKTSGKMYFPVEKHVMKFLDNQYSWD